MSNITLIATHENGLIEIGKWTSTTWTVRADRTAIVNLRYYMNDEKDDDISIKISDDNYEQIFELLESGKTHDNTNFSPDGSGWSFKQYENNIQVYKRDVGSIEGVDDFQKLEKLLYKVARVNIPA